LSVREVKDLLAERGVAVFYETVRRWVNHFGPMIAASLRKCPPKPHTIRHLDEVYLKIDGRRVCLWRAVDAEGEVLDVLVQTNRNRDAALKLMRKLRKKIGCAPEVAITDELRSYRAAARDLGVGSAQRFLSTHAATYATFNVQRHRTSANTHRAFRASVVKTWRDAAIAVV
jgi:transposase-like protein